MTLMGKLGSQKVPPLPGRKTVQLHQHQVDSASSQLKFKRTIKMMKNRNQEMNVGEILGLLGH